jgi:hypothetical protein
LPLSTERRVRPKLLTDLPPDLATLIEDVQVDNRGRLIPRLYSKERANKELRNLLNLSAKSEAPDVTKLIENQIAALRQIAERRGWEVVEHHDAGISGAKGRDGRPGLDQMLKDASKRKFHVIMAWAIDRLGRSLIDLLGTIQTLEACGVDL